MGSGAIAMPRGFITRYHAEDDGTSTGGTGDDQGNVKPSDILARYGQTAESALRMAEKLAESENKNYQLRDKNRTLRQETTDLKAKTPLEGGRVLTKDESAAYDAYVALGQPADALKTALDGAQNVTQELATLRRTQQLHDVHALTGYDPDVLGDIGPGWSYRIAEEQIDGKPGKAVYVKDGDKEQRIDQHPKVIKFLPSLTVASVSPPPVARGTAFVQQHSGVDTGAGDRADQFIRQQAEARAKQMNPLMKQQGA